MNKNIKFGIIKNLKSENFLFGGIAYLKNEKIFKNGKFIDNENIVDFISGVDKTSARINMNFAFAKKIEEIKNKRNNKIMKYFALATNMVYILSMPILIMLGFYMLLKKYLFKTDQPIILVIFLILGAVSGYWSLIKQINNIK